MSSRSEQQEIDTFTKWVNVHLKKRELEITDIFTEFASGVKLIALYEQISGFEFKSYNKNPKLKLQAIENLRQVLTKIQEFLDQMKIKVVYGAEQIYDDGDGKSDKTQVLGLLWVLISKFVIAAGADEEDEATKSLKAELLKWCQDNTSSYDNVNIVDFSHSWQDGLGLCALIHNFFPDRLDYHSLSPENKLDNIKLATATAETLGIDNLIDEEELAFSEKPNEKAMMTYIATYRNNFKKLADEIKARRLQEQVNRYEDNVRNLLQSLRDRIDEFNNASFDESTHVEAQNALSQLFQYRTDERQSLTSQKTALDLEYITLCKDRARQRAEPYAADDEVSSATTAATVSELQQSEAAYQQRIQQRIDSFRTQVEGFDAQASEYIRATLEAAQNGNPDDADNALSENQQQADDLLNTYDALHQDDLSKYVSVDIESVVQVRDLLQFSFGQEMSDHLKSVTKK